MPVQYFSFVPMRPPPGHSGFQAYPYRNHAVDSYRLGVMGVEGVTRVHLMAHMLFEVCHSRQLDYIDESQRYLKTPGQ
jgi:hypothetical protein